MRQSALEVRGLRRSPLLNDVSFKLYPGEVLGVAALEGQGQEELFDCIAGSRRYDEGAIFAHGKELRLRHPADAIAGRYRPHTSKPIVGPPSSNGRFGKISPCPPSAAFGIGVRSGCARSERA